LYQGRAGRPQWKTPTGLADAHAGVCVETSFSGRNIRTHRSPPKRILLAAASQGAPKKIRLSRPRHGNFFQLTKSPGARRFAGRARSRGLRCCCAKRGASNWMGESGLDHPTLTPILFLARRDMGKPERKSVEGSRQSAPSFRCSKDGGARQSGEHHGKYFDIPCANCVGAGKPVQEAARQLSDGRARSFQNHSPGGGAAGPTTTDSGSAGLSSSSARTPRTAWVHAYTMRLQRA